MSLQESLQIAAPLGRLWHFAALQPGALVGLLRLRGERLEVGNHGVLFLSQMLHSLDKKDLIKS